MDSILEYLNQQLGDDVIRQMSSQIDADPDATRQAVSAALPMLIGALGRNAADPAGAQALTSALKNDHDGSVLNDLLGFVMQGGQSANGAGILGHILGGRQSNVEAGIGKATGLDASSVGKLLVMLAPIVMGGLGRARQEKNLEPADVSDILGKERQRAESSLGGLARMLDADGDGSIADDLLGIGGKLLGNFMRRK